MWLSLCSLDSVYLSVINVSMSLCSLESQLIDEWLPCECHCAHSSHRLLISDYRMVVTLLTRVSFWISVYRMSVNVVTRIGLLISDYRTIATLITRVAVYWSVITVWLSIWSLESKFIDKWLLCDCLCAHSSHSLLISDYRVNVTVRTRVTVY